MRRLLIYLDNCCFNRPFDDQSSMKVFLETQAKMMIQSHIRDNTLSLLWSFILDYENSANPDEMVMEEIRLWRKSAKEIITLDENIVKFDVDLTNAGFGKKDALHIACACRARADFFITVDKGIIKKANSVKEIKIVNPIEFISFLEEENEN